MYVTEYLNSRVVARMPNGEVQRHIGSGSGR